MRVLVTGASGLVGSNLTEAAARRGWDVTGTWHTTPVTFARAKIIQLDTGDAAECAAVVAELRPDVIIHAAASVQLSRLESDDELARANVTGTENTLAAAGNVAARYVLVSSDWVFSGERPPGDCWHETDEAAPVNAYGRSKLASEQAVSSSTLDWLITRPANVYGINLARPSNRGDLASHVWKRSSLALRWVQLLRSGRPIPAPSAVYQCPTYAWDHAQRTLDLISQGHHGVWNLAGPAALHRRAYLRALAQAFDCDPALVVEGDVSDFLEACGDDPRLPLPANTDLCNSKAEAALGPGVGVDRGHRLMRYQLETALPIQSHQEAAT